MRWVIVIASLTVLISALAIMSALCIDRMGRIIVPDSAFQNEDVE